ncbi:MAG: YbaB/EbfC family nucleoid-associated protein [Methylococcales bacterium]|jgi:nucleoid-associated protein EbfC|nr:YbaB/EbfC family nucleoid-associated protein [Methylococcales bacterium]MBT7410931.1 YbaB/EbfC family nucleoid-associated protein [Methylococcales bacterium]
MKGVLGNFMKQAQDMQDNMQKAQKELSNMEVVGESGGGMVKITMTGKHEVKSVDIDNVLLSDDKEMLEDLVAAAFNSAVQKVAKENEEKMSGMVSGVNLPPGLGDIFKA